jgi:hypothetical protein
MGGKGEMMGKGRGFGVGMVKKWVRKAWEEGMKRGRWGDAFGNWGKRRLARRLHGVWGGLGLELGG